MLRKALKASLRAQDYERLKGVANVLRRIRRALTPAEPPPLEPPEFPPRPRKAAPAAAPEPAAAPPPEPVPAIVAMPAPPAPPERHPVPLHRIRDALEQCGVRRGDLLLVHSSCNTLIKGSTERDDATPSDLIGYSIAITDLLLDMLGPTGTLLMPTEALGDVMLFSRKKQVFDHRTFPSNRGLITELFRRRDGVIRSVHPWYNLTGIGPQAHDLMREHHLSTPYTMDEHSPWYKLTKRGGKAVFLGPNLDNNSLLHLPEYLYPDEYPRPIYYNRPIPLRYVDYRGAECVMDVAIHVPNWRGGVAAGFCAYLDKKYHIYRTALAGDAVITAYDAEAQFQALCEEMRQDVCWYDVRYWDAAA